MVPCKFFAEGRCTKGDACQFQHDSGAGIYARPLTETRQAPCRFFAEGRCTKGAACQFEHDARSVVCKYFKQGFCNNHLYYNGTCPFSHGLEEEPQAVKPPSKNVVCKFFMQGRCNNHLYYGGECPFVHSAEEMLPATGGENLRKVPCKFFLQGRCDNGALCRFDHGDWAPPSTSVAEDAAAAFGRSVAATIEGARLRAASPDRSRSRSRAGRRRRDASAGRRPLPRPWESLESAEQQANIYLNLERDEPLSAFFA